MQIVEHAVIAAAGMGTRLGFGQPKCLIEVNGKPLIGHLLDRLRNVPNVRVVTGFMAADVIDYVSQVRKDVIFVQNHAFRSTTTLTSYVMGAVGINSPVLYMDADIYFEPNSFSNFLVECEQKTGSIIAVTHTKTQDCVYVHRDTQKCATGFSRTKASDWEWANLAWLEKNILRDRNTSVYVQLEKSLPLKTCEIIGYEVDTPEDYSVLMTKISKNEAS